MALIGVVIGGAIASATAYLSQRSVERRARNDFLIRRLEEIYTGCQRVYEGHLLRTDWLVERAETSAEDWKLCPPWPGGDMSNIKLAVRAYVPNLEAALTQMDEAHQWFKALDKTLKDRASTGASLVRHTDYDPGQLNEQLQKLGAGSLRLKQAAIRRLQETLR